MAKKIKLPPDINQSQLAAAIGVNKAAVSQWLSKKNGIPAARCPQIEAITGIKCEVLRPDIPWRILRVSNHQ